jgi:hypothetical protein
MAASWTDSLGNFWLFGGFGKPASGQVVNFDNGLGALNDLWKWDGSNWIWVSGSTMANDLGSGYLDSYPRHGVQTYLGGLFDSLSLIDSKGKLWLLGGLSYTLFNNTLNLIGSSQITLPEK